MIEKSKFLNLNYLKAITYVQYRSNRDCRIERSRLIEEGCIFKQSIFEKIKKAINLRGLLFEKIVDPKATDDLYNQAMKLLFIETDLYNKVEDFVINNTMKLDNQEINQEEYDDQVELFLYYLSKTNNDSKRMTANISKQTFEKAMDQETLNKLDEYGEEFYGNMKVDNTRLKKFIDCEKEEIYEKDLINKLSIRRDDGKSEVIDKYIDYYGDKWSKSGNLMALNKYLNQELLITKSIVGEKYKEIINKIEIQNLENNLFGSSRSDEFHTIEYIDTLDGFEFEDYLKELFESFGYTCEDLPYTNDYGADLIISKGITRTVIQAKNYTGTVGNKAVQEVISAKSYYKCDFAMVITNAEYTRNAIEMAKNTDVILIDRYKLIEILNKGFLYFNSIMG